MEELASFGSFPRSKRKYHYGCNAVIYELDEDIRELIFKKLAEEKNRTLTIWNCGCSGEIEAYLISLEMAFKHFPKEDINDWKIKIIGTDSFVGIVRSEREGLINIDDRFERVGKKIKSAIKNKNIEIDYQLLMPDNLLWLTEFAETYKKQGFDIINVGLAGYITKTNKKSKAIAKIIKDLLNPNACLVAEQIATNLIMSEFDEESEVFLRGKQLFGEDILIVNIGTRKSEIVDVLKQQADNPPEGIALDVWRLTLYSQMKVIKDNLESVRDLKIQSLQRLVTDFSPREDAFIKNQIIGYIFTFGDAKTSFKKIAVFSEISKVNIIGYSDGININNFVYLEDKEINKYSQTHLNSGVFLGGNESKDREYYKKLDRFFSQFVYLGLFDKIKTETNSNRQNFVEQAI